MRLMEDFFNIRFHEGGNAFDQVWKTFRRNGIISTRGEHFFVGGKKCAVIAKARFLCPEDSYEYIQDVTLWEYCSPDPHAEIKAIHHIKKIDERATLMSVDMIMSFLPCGNCAKEIAEFSKSHPRCPITLRFSTVYKDYKPHNRAGLRVLNSNKMITLRVFTKREWAVLAELTQRPVHKYNEDLERRDSYWKKILDEILNEVIQKSSLPSTSNESGGDKESEANRGEGDEKEEIEGRDVIGGMVKAESGGETEEEKEIKAKEEEENERRGEKRELEEVEENEGLEGELQKRSRS